MTAVFSQLSAFCHFLKNEFVNESYRLFTSELNLTLKKYETLLDVQINWKIDAKSIGISEHFFHHAAPFFLDFSNHFLSLNLKNQNFKPILRVSPSAYGLG